MVLNSLDSRKYRMKILVVSNLYPTEQKPYWGIFVKEQVSSLRKNYSRELHIDVHLIDGAKSKKEYLKTLFRLPGIVRKGNYDLIHAHYGLSLISLIFVQIPIVITFHGGDLLRWKIVKYISKLLCRKAAYAIVVSENLRRELGYGTIIPCGIRTEDFFIPNDLREEQFSKSTGTDNLNVLFPSNPDVKVKDYDLFESVCKELQKRGKRIREIHLNGIARQEVPKVYWNSDVMVLTSKSEGSPTVIKEAIAAKLPFVSVDVGDVKEWSESTDFGRVLQTRNPRKIADCIIDLVNNVPKRAQLDNKNALKKMDINEVAKKIKRIYEKVVMANLTG